MKTIECDFSVHPRKGEFYVLGHDTPVKVSHIISSVPTPKTRGVLVIPTTDDNVLVGPTADDVEDKDDRKTTREGLEEVQTKALEMVPGLCFAAALPPTCYRTEGCAQRQPSRASRT